MVTLQVFPEGKGPENGFAYAKFPLTVKGGSVSAKWKWNADSRELPPEQDPKFVFSAHSAWCNYKKSSGTLTVELKRPEITKAEWQDRDGKSVSKGLVGETLKLYAETKDTAEGAGVTFRVYDSKTKEMVAEPAVKMDGKKAEAEWAPKDIRKAGDTSELTYYFEAETPRAKKVKSSDIKIKNPQIVSMTWEKQAVYYSGEVKLTIKTFEVSEFAPSCKLLLRNVAAATDEAPVKDQTITIDKDEVEVKIKIDFDLDKQKKINGGKEVGLCAEILCEKMIIKECRQDMLCIETGPDHA